MLLTKKVWKIQHLDIVDSCRHFGPIINNPQLTENAPFQIIKSVSFSKPCSSSMINQVRVRAGLGQVIVRSGSGQGQVLPWTDSNRSNNDQVKMFPLEVTKAPFSSKLLQAPFICGQFTLLVRNVVSINFPHESVLRDFFFV